MCSPCLLQWLAIEYDYGNNYIYYLLSSLKKYGGDLICTKRKILVMFQCNGRWKWYISNYKILLDISNLYTEINGLRWMGSQLFFTNLGFLPLHTYLPTFMLLCQSEAVYRGFFLISELETRIGEFLRSVAFNLPEITAKHGKLNSLYFIFISFILQVCVLFRDLFSWRLKLPEIPCVKNAH